MDEVTEALARFACEGEAETKSLAVARLSILDWAAVGLAARHELVAKILIAQAKEEAGTPQTSIFGNAFKVPARMAALVNGTVSHALDYDDTHFAHIGHPSVAVIPAALAAAELIEAEGDAFQAAALIGMEASIRVGEWLGRDHYQVGFHQTSTSGAFGATVAAGRLLGLNLRQMRMALGLVATRASGLKAEFGTMGKPFNAGQAAANGVEAALLAAKGFEAEQSALSGALGFFATHHGAGSTQAFDGLGESWRFPKVKHKFHACCHGLHAALEALRGNQRVPSDISAIRIFTHPRWMSVCNIARPTTGLETKFSYTMVTAMSLLGHDTARLDSFRDDLCGDVEALGIMDLIKVSEQPDLSEMQARIEIDAHGGTQKLFHDLDEEIALDERRARIEAKATSLLGEQKVRELRTLISRADTASSFAKSLRGG
ncbi:MAG: MmgE/PrpD family protein [Pseudomonadota bacterium]